MKVVILAGGWGSRLGQQTENIPKPMINIGEKPILWHIMKIYSKYGHNDFVISCGVKAQVIKSYFANYQYYNNDFTVDTIKQKIKSHNQNKIEPWKVTLVDTGLNTLKGGRIKKVEKYLDADTNMIAYGDCVANIDINKLVDFHKSHGKKVTLTGVNPPARFGELIEKDNKVISFNEKPQTSVGLINGGFMIFNRDFLDYLTPEQDCDLEIGPIEKLVEEGELMVYKHSGEWGCLDHERDLEYLNHEWGTGQAFWKVW